MTRPRADLNIRKGTSCDAPVAVAAARLQVIGLPSVLGSPLTVRLWAVGGMVTARLAPQRGSEQSRSNALRAGVDP